MAIAHQHRGEQSLPQIEQVYRVITRLPGEFVTKDVIDSLPHLNPPSIAVYMGDMEKRGIVMRSGKQTVSTHAGRARRSRRQVILWRKVPNHEVPVFGKKPAKPKPPPKPRTKKEKLRARIPEPHHAHGFDERIENVVELMMQVAAEIEQLKLEHLNDVEFAREIKRRKDRKFREKNQ